MGLWYASSYIGYPAISGSAWAEALYNFLKKNQDYSAAHPIYNGPGAFAYYGGTTSFQAGTMTGAGIWSLAMIGETSTVRGAPMIEAAVNWFNNNYSWTTCPGDSTAYYYFVYAMSKGLTGSIGTAATMGAHDWVHDLKSAMLAKKTTVDANTNYWYSGDGLDPDKVITTSWVLMSLAFASTNTPSTEKIVVPPDVPDFPIGAPQFAVLSTTGGASISAASWVNNGVATQTQHIKLPIGAFDFTIHLPEGATTALLRIGNLPPGTLSPDNPNSFVDADGNLKPNLRWFKIAGGAWKGVNSVPITISLAGNYIEVTLTDEALRIRTAL